MVLQWTAPAALADEFRSVGQSPAILYDAPSRKAARLFVAPPGMPVEVMSTLGQWVKVRDMSGDVVWIERTDLVARRTVIARVRVSVHLEPDDAADVVLVAERGVLFELAQPEEDELPVPDGWVMVRHRDGDAGFVRAAGVWGH
jgi:SH3-like domain-containing protein